MTQVQALAVNRENIVSESEKLNVECVQSEDVGLPEQKTQSKPPNSTKPVGYLPTRPTSLLDVEPNTVDLMISTAQAFRPIFVSIKTKP